MSEQKIEVSQIIDAIDTTVGKEMLEYIRVYINRKLDFHNDGVDNIGHGNSGDKNIGSGNEGSMNVGDNNDGNGNAGSHNMGSCNMGDFNKGDNNVGFFNTTDGRIKMFNKEVPEGVEFELPSFLYNIQYSKWVPEAEMTGKEREDNINYKEKGGYIKQFKAGESIKYTYNNLSEEEKQKEAEKLKALPNWDSDIFFEITDLRI